MANRPSDIDATLLQLEILRRIPKLPAVASQKNCETQPIKQRKNKAH